MAGPIHCPVAEYIDSHHKDNCGAPLLAYGFKARVGCNGVIGQNAAIAPAANT